MTTKANKFYRPINCFLFSTLTIVIFSCNNNLDNKISQAKSDSLQANNSTNIDNTLKNINLVDTIRNLLAVSSSKDTFEYETFYNENSPYLLLYFKTGNLFSPKIKHAIALRSINDTTILCELHYLVGNKWVDSGNNIFMHIDRFSPAFFQVRFDDYNFDGYKDLFINFYQSMSVAYSYGYILTFSQHNSSLTLHPETIEIPNLEIDKKAKQLISTVYSNPHENKEVFEIVSRFGWIKEEVKFLSKEERLYTIWKQ